MWWRRRLYLVTVNRAQRRRSQETPHKGTRQGTSVGIRRWHHAPHLHHNGRPRLEARASPECDRTPLSTPGSRRDLGHELHRPSRIHATANRATAHALQASQPRSSLLATVAVAVKTMPIAELTGLAVRRSEHIWRTCSLMCASQRCKGGTLSTRGP